MDFMAMQPIIKIRGEPANELRYFTVNYDKGLDWYTNQMPCSYENQITVAKSPDYFQHPLAPMRIHAMDPSMKLIAIVREPVTRAWSHFTYELDFLPNLKAKCFLNFEDCAIDSKTGGVCRWCHYVKHFTYDDGFERYLHYFNRTQIKMIDYVKLLENPYVVLREIEDFLNIEHIIKNDNFVFNERERVFYIRRGEKSETA